MTADALLPVGRDCECGHPLVWRHGKQWCAVYGSHPIHPERDRSAPLAAVVDELARMPMPTKKRPIRRDAARQLSAKASR